MKKYGFIIFICIIAFACKTKNNNEDFKYISIEEYKDAVYASWIGQIIGNTYGLGYEFKFIDNPGPDKFPYGYSFTLQDLKKHDGAYSDDDTDIEYMYLTQMEKNGIEPSYKNLAEAWKTHVKERIWFANRMAVTLMHAGHYPPVTGNKDFNSEWFQIDPQLVNEIWAVTSPGMIEYAVEKSEYSARITSDSFGLEPTLHYAAMYSAAFFEKDIHKLIDTGLQALPKNSRFATIVEHVKKLYEKYPNDWQRAREEVKNAYYKYEDYNKLSWAPVDANLNGALGIMALLYGKGDFWKTLDYCCALGMDADNQAATMCGLLGIINGFKSIPKELMFPLKDAQWTKPFNDSYKMITREGLESATITDLANRTAAMGEKIILARGGEIVEKEGKKYYKIKTTGSFEPPFELNPIPQLVTRIGKAINYPIYTGKKDHVKYGISGNAPEGIKIENGILKFNPVKAGNYSFKITASFQNIEKSIDASIIVYSKNLAPDASKILCSSIDGEAKTEILRDGSISGTLYSKKEKKQSIVYFGYEWNSPQEISALVYNNGKSQEFGGWFTSFDVEYLEHGVWKKVSNYKVYPSLNLDNSQWLKACFMNYHISFPKLTTQAIRIVGQTGGIEKDAANAHLGKEFYTSIAELEVY